MNNPRQHIRIWGLALLALMTGTLLPAQLGIGNAAPDTASVLDLTNPGEKGWVLPPATSTASFSNTLLDGMTYFTGDHIHYKRSDGYNALTPWNYKLAGNTTEDVYYNSGGKVSIGATTLTTTPDAPLQIQPDLPVSLLNHGTLEIGNSTGNNMVLNTGEIQARNNGVGALLVINENGGDIEAGSVPGPVEVNVTGRVYAYDQPTATYYELVPPGTITMWFGATTNVPDGWAICDGGTYTKSDNSGPITTPDLQGMFLVSRGASGNSAYLPHDTGGIDLVTLTADQNPPHNHTVNLTTSNGGSHRHSMGGDFGEHDGNGSGGEDGFEDAGSRDTGSAGSHNHTLTGNTQNVGGTPHENRPPFHALVYIMKL